MNIIQLLPDHVANQIAAGEVIQRPASAVKEILENSLDAGSKNIKVFIKHSGKTLIHILDDGCGMSKADLKMCCERHATSKIKNADDLFNIRSMGFRGEAMASIAAIAHIEIKSKLTQEKMGAHIIIEGSEIKNHEDCITNNGTSIKVKNLFYNVPARRNFLKSDRVEIAHITEEFTRIALANPNVKMQLFHNEDELFHLPDSNFRQRIVNVFGNKKNDQLVPINEETSLVKISGFIGKPESARKTRGEQYLLVNKRFIKSYYINHAINKAFEGLIADKYFPSYFINIEVDPKTIDINIHPTKTEIKFDDEQSIYAIIRATIKKSLGEYNIAPSIDFSQELSFNIDFPIKKGEKLKPPTIKIDPNYNPFKKERKEILASEKSNKKFDQKVISEKIDSDNESTQNNQIGNKFILSTGINGILLIHQRRAHKRILFEYFRGALKKQKNQSQKLLFPKKINLQKNEADILISIEKELNIMGFIFELSNDNITITGIPPECQEENLQSIIEELVENMKNKQKIELTQTDVLAKSLATSTAIAQKKKLSNQEMTSLEKELLKCKKPTICPQGKPTMVNLKMSDLEKYFKNV